MQRLLVQQARTITLQWREDAEAFELRLMSGNRYLTPRLIMNPLDCYRLMLQERVEIGGWLILGRVRTEMRIIPLKQLRYDEDGREPQEWPSCSFNDFYTLATMERGDRPESGYQEVLRLALDRQRETF